MSTPTFTTVAGLNGADGTEPAGGLIANANGDIFGTAINADVGTGEDDGLTYEIQGDVVYEIPFINGSYATTPTILAVLDQGDNAGYYPGFYVDAAGDLFGTDPTGGDAESAIGGDIHAGAVYEIPFINGSYATTPTILVSFNGNNGEFPGGNLIADPSGDLFGTTAGGTVFEIAKTSTGYASTPITLAHPGFSQGGVIINAAGDLFGTTRGGSVFEIAKTSTGYASTLITLANFNGANGDQPLGGLAIDASGDLFGTTSEGGAFPNTEEGGTNGNGTVFEIPFINGSYASTPTTLVNFNSTDGELPQAGVIIDAAGDLFGTTEEGGADGVGTVFEVARTGGSYASTPITLVSFGVVNGNYAEAGLIANSAGDLFSTTQIGGNAGGDGQVFELTNAGFQVAPPGLLGGLNVNQQLELIYIAYFDRAADGAGYTFWEGQNVTAQNAGQSAALALTNIANSFAPQSETEALYPSLDPYLVPNPPPLNTPAGQTALSTFIGSVYESLFDRPADLAGKAYWVDQLTAGAVALGAAALAIASGATASDAIEVQNKITVALDFTTRTAAAGLGETSPLPASFKTEAATVLSGVDSTSLNDASVTAGENATTTFISDTSTSASTAVTTDTVTDSKMSPASPAAATIASANSNIISVTSSGQLIDPGAGNHTIQFLAGASADTAVLHFGGADEMTSFDPGTDVLDFSSLLSEANIDLNGSATALGNYVTIAVQGGNALINFDPTGHGRGGTVAVLQGLGSVVTGFNTLGAELTIRT